MLANFAYAVSCTSLLIEQFQVEFAPHYVLQNYAAFRSLLVPPEAEEYPADSLDVIT